MEDSEVKMNELEEKIEEPERMQVNQEETVADVKWFNGSSSNSSAVAGAPPPPASSAGADDVINSLDEMDRTLPPRVKFNKYDMYYDMTGEKRLVIFNHKTYEKTRYFEFRRPSERNGTERDVKSLQDTFQDKGFKTIVHNDLRHVEILKTMSDLCKEDHRPTSCIVVAIMTHGDDEGVFAADRPYRLSDVTNILQGAHPGLVGKPKLLFVQACRGANMDDGRRVQTDGGENIVLPTHADMLIMYSTVEQHLAYRDSEGSWLMQSLCEVLDEYHQSYDLLQMITFVNQAVAYRSTYTRNANTTNKKMIPETKFTLTKLLRF